MSFEKKKLSDLTYVLCNINKKYDDDVNHHKNRMWIKNRNLILFLLFIVFLYSTSASTKEANIYGDYNPIILSQEAQQGIVASLTVMLFVLLAADVAAPEVLFLIALMVCCLAQILTLKETLAGSFSIKL